MVSLFLSCRALSSPTICRFIPAHCPALEILLGTEKASEGAFVSVELVDAAGKRRLLPVSDFGQAGRSYSELIPAGVPFRLEVASQKFQLAEIASVPGSTRVTNGRFELPVTASVRTVQATTKRRTMFDRRLPEPAISVNLKVEGRKP